MYFPKLDDDDTKSDLYRQILIAKCDLVLEDSEENRQKLYSLLEQYRQSTKPLSFWPHNPKNDWVRFKRHFERMYAILEEAGVKNGKELTVYEFYSRLEYLKDKAQPKPGK